MKTWPKGTLKLVQGLWAMLIATLMIYGAIFEILPHLLEDGAFTTEDLYLVGGLVAVALLAALPGVWMELLGNSIVAYREWRSRKA